MCLPQMKTLYQYTSQDIITILIDGLWGNVTYQSVWKTQIYYIFNLNLLTHLFLSNCKLNLENGTTQGDSEIFSKRSFSV